MATITVSNQIAAPVHRAFEYFTDIESGPAHVTGIKRIELLTPGKFDVIGHDLADLKTSLEH